MWVWNIVEDMRKGNQEINFVFVMKEYYLNVIIF